jgi:uncharacterized protein YneF (UPF0154 family)
MLEKPLYFGLFKEGPAFKEGNLKDSPDYNKFSGIIRKIDQNQRLLYLEWDGSNIFLGVQFHCSSVSTLDSRPVRDSRRMYFEQISYGKNDPPNLPQILQQFYLRADKKIKSFYSERYDKIQMRLATSRDFNEFISGYSPKPPLSADNEISKYFGGKILFNERCTVLSSDFINSIKMITDLFEVLKRDKMTIVFIISELDNPNDTQLAWDFLIRIPLRSSEKNQNIQSFTYDADNQTFSESSFTQGIYKLLYNYIAENRSLIPKVQDYNISINNFIQSCVSSKESAKMPIGELCKSKLGIIIAKELIIKKLKNNEKIDSDILKLVYSSLTSAEQAEFGRTLLDNDYDFPELYTDSIKKMILDQDKKNFTYFISKDFLEYREFHTALVSTFKKLPWDNSKFSSNAKKTLELIFSKYPPDTVGEGGKIFTGLLYQNLSDREEIDKEFVQKYSEKMSSFDIKIPTIPDKSLVNNTKLRWSIIGYAAFAAGIFLGGLFAWFYNQVLPTLLQQLNGFIDPAYHLWILISGIIIVILILGYFIYKRKFRQKIVRN